MFRQSELAATSILDIGVAPPSHGKMASNQILRVDKPYGEY